MERVVKIVIKDNGPDRIGIPISKGPGTFRLMITWPYMDEGQIAEVPLENIERIDEAIQGPMKKSPKTVGIVQFDDAVALEPGDTTQAGALQLLGDGCIRSGYRRQVRDFPVRGTLPGMARDLKMKKDKAKKKGSTLRDLYRLALVIIGVIAIVKELQKPAKERTWHGKVADFVPYDFRMPTADRIRDTYWNPDGPVISSKAFGVGWAPNFGSVKRLVS